LAQSAVASGKTWSAAIKAAAADETPNPCPLLQQLEFFLSCLWLCRTKLFYCISFVSI